MKVRIISFILLFTIFFSTFSVPANAENIESGRLGEEINWYFDKETGHLTISGNGSIYYDVPLYNEVLSVSIEGNITEIERYALGTFPNATSVTLCDSISKIGEYVFSSYTNLKEITLPKSLRRIEPYTFSNCTNLETVNFNNGLSSIGQYAFSKCYSLKSIYLPSSVSGIGKNAFEYCDSLESIRVNRGNLFFYSEDNVLYDYSKTQLIRYAPANAKTNFTIPSSVRSISEGAFLGASNLLSINMSDNVTMIYRNAFNSCASLENIYLSKELLYLGLGVFSMCTSLEKIALPDIITTIPENAFYNCENLKLVKVGNNISVIDNSAFYNCYELETFDFSNISSIGSSAFENTAISSVNFSENLKMIYGSAFESTNIVSLTLPDSVNSIGYGAFQRCYDLKEVTFGDNITTIPQLCFYECYELENVKFGKSLTRIEDYAFSTCPKITEANFGYNIRSIGKQAFDSARLNMIAFGKSLISVGNYAFAKASPHYKYYQGSLEDWEKVNKGSLYNNCLWDTSNFIFNTMPEDTETLYEAPSPKDEYNVKINFDNISTSIEYSDNFFSESSFKYNHDLSKASIRLALSAFSTKNTKEQYTNVYNLLSDELKFNDVSYNDWYTKAPERHSIAVIAGNKHIEYPDGNYTLIAVAVRGGNYKNEWGGNFCLGTGTLHEGFATARNTVLSFINKYISDNNITGNIKLWITGYSRAAATVNLTAAYLDDNPDLFGNAVTLTPNNIYAYCFETPMGVINPDNASGRYDNIFSIVNYHDFVPKLAMSQWGYNRYGVTFFLPSGYTHGFAYIKLKEKITSKYKEYADTDYLIDNAIYLQLLKGQGAYLDDLINNLTSTIGSLDTYSYYYQDLFEFLGEELLGKRSLDDTLTVFVKKLLEKNIIVSDGNGNFKLNNSLAYKSNSQEFFAVSNALYTALLETFSYFGITVTEDLLYNLADLISNIGVINIIELYLNKDALIQSHSPTLCMSWLDVISEDDFATEIMLFIKTDTKFPFTIFDENNLPIFEYNKNTRNSITSELAYSEENDNLIVYLPSDCKYSVEIHATEDAELTYSINELNAITGNTNITLYNTSVAPNTLLTGSIEKTAESEGLYTLSANDSLIEATSKTENAKAVTIAPTSTGKGNVTPAFTAYPGEKVTVIATPNEGESFIAWYNDFWCDESSIVSYDTNYTFTVEETNTLVAAFTSNTCDVVFKDTNNNIIGVANCKKGGTVTFPDAPEKEGMEFAGYYSDYYTTEPASKDDAIWENTTIYAKYLCDYSFYYAGSNIIITGYNGNEKHIEIPEKIDNCTVVGISSSTHFEDNIESITLPKTFQDFYSYIFDNCSSLKEVNIAEGNENFHSIDGVVYNSDSTLVYYPQGKTDESLHLPESMTFIPEIKNRFLKTLYLHKNMVDVSWYPLEETNIDTIFYPGTEEDFSDILNEWEENGVLNNAKVYFNYNSTPVSAFIDSSCEDNTITTTITYSYVLEDCTAYVAIYNSDNHLLCFKNIGKVSAHQEAPTTATIKCAGLDKESYAKVIFIKNFSALSPAGMWTATDIY